jgi:chemotaxis protein CheX
MEKNNTTNNFNTHFLEFSIPFVNSLKNIYSTMCNNSISTLKPNIGRIHDQDIFYTAFIGLNGNLNKENGMNIKFYGSLVISWTKESYLELASGFLGEEYQDLTDDIKDLGMEVINMTVGGAKTLVTNLGYKIDLSLPSSVIGPNIKLQTEKNVINILVPINTSTGKKIFMQINYSESNEEKS